jgi:hypothetical protein
MSKHPPKYPWTTCGHHVLYKLDGSADFTEFWLQHGPDFERDGALFRWERERDAEWRVVPRQAVASSSIS